MTTILIRLFVGDPRDLSSDRARSALGTLSGTVGILCNLLLFAGKLAAGLLSGSVSVTADALNNLSDASGSIVTLIGFRIADKPADEHHPYGHARAEYLSGLAVTALILVIGFELAKTSVEKIFAPVPVEFSGITAAVLAVSIGVKLWLTVFNRKLGKLIGSTALMATALDSRNDCAATAAVFGAAVLERFLDIRADGWIGLGVALFILYSGVSLAKETVSPLLGENADPELRQKILAIVASQPKVLGYHDLMVHDYGPGSRYASLHVEMDHREDPLACHEWIDDMERECLRRHNVHMVIHYDPIITDDPSREALKLQVEALLQDQDSRLHFHDFRMVQGRQHMNLLFDVILPSGLQGREDAIQSAVEAGLNAGAERRYHVKITFDTGL